MSHPAWGEWIEMTIEQMYAMKQTKSHPAWGEWIEIQMGDVQRFALWSHPAWGEWIEISTGISFIPRRRCLTPHGVSGLKSQKTYGR